MTEPQIEHRLLTAPGELRVDAAKRTIFGLANVFGNKDSYGTIFDKGVFKRTIREDFKRNNKVRLLFNHDPWMILGKLTELEETDDGLRYVGRIAQTPLGDEILTHIQDGALTDNSIGFMRRKTRVVEEDDATEEDLEGLHFTDVDLWDVSPVTWGANDLAIMEGVRTRFGPTLDPKGLADEVMKHFQIAVPDLSGLTAKVEAIESSVSELRSDLEALAPATPSQGSEPNSEPGDNENNEETDQARLRTRRAQLSVVERESS